MSKGRPGPNAPARTARTLAAEVVARVLDEGAWAQPSLAAALKTSQLDARDKGLCTELVYGVLRWAAPLEKSLLRSADKPGRGLDKRMRPHLLVAAYQLQHLSERIPAHAAVSEAVNAVRAVRPGLDGFANALLRRLGSPLHALLKPESSIDEVAEAVGAPRFLARAMVDGLPASDVQPALLALNARPTTYAFALGEVPAGAATHAFVPRLFALEGGAVTDVAGFDTGGFLVLDPGSAIAALLVDAQPGQRVIDLCAAPGGKTVLLARGVGSTGNVVAVEQDERRAARITENLARTRLAERVQLVVEDARAHAGPPADAVLLDAPCTGLGTTRRKPEIKLRRTEADVESNMALQAELLEKAGTLVKPGGVLVYSVCSPLPPEGRRQVERFVANNPAFSVEDPRSVLPWLPDSAVDARGCVRLLPHLHDADAFFCARLKKR